LAPAERSLIHSATGGTRLQDATFKIVVSSPARRVRPVKMV
jgi:hypothetical protein